MCTAIFHGGFLGRNLDLNRTPGEQVALTPRKFPLPFRRAPSLPRHYAILGTAHLREGYPLYYDAVSETGLAMAGLHFPRRAVWQSPKENADNIAPFELIPWVLGQCADLAQARVLLSRTNLMDEAFSPTLPLTPLHWMLADRTGCLVLEPMADGLHISPDPAGVLTNSPALEEQLAHLATFPSLSPRKDGCVGLPGDLSSPSRFVRAAFHLRHAPTGGDSLTRCFRLLDTVAHPDGSAVLEDGSCQVTVYTACCDLRRGDYYFSTRENRRIRAVAPREEELDREGLTLWPMTGGQDIDLLTAGHPLPSPGF